MQTVYLKTLSQRLAATFLALLLVTTSVVVLTPLAEAQSVDKSSATLNAEQSLKTIMLRIMSANGIPTTRLKDIQVIEGEDYNAATDGQILYMTQSLYRALSTDDQKAFVLSHELSHVTLGHMNRTAIRHVGLSLLDRFVLARVGNSGRTWEQLKLLGVTALDTKFSRQMELQADDRGIQYMTRAEYRPQAALEVFDILQSQDKSSTPQFLRSHPLSKNRIQQLVKKYGLTR